jgi:hypothetical protein
MKRILTLSSSLAASLRGVFCAGALALCGPGAAWAAPPADTQLPPAITLPPITPVAGAAHALWIAGAPAPPEPIRAAPRVNVPFAGAWARKPWRFALEGNPFVSRPWPWRRARR